MQPPSHQNESAALLAQGIAALKAGDKARARELLGRAIQHNPRDELAWLWMSGAVETDWDRQRCLQRVLAINPHNAAARQGLASLASPSPAERAPAVAAPAPTRAPALADPPTGEPPESQ
jgi:hypothetical protein